MSSTRPPHAHGLLQFLRALFGLVGLATLLVAIPAALWEFGQFPTIWATPTEWGQALLEPDDGTLLLTVLTLVGWALWVWLALPVLIEAGALLTRRVTPRLPGMATPQRLASYLLGALLVASPAAAASATTPASATSATTAQLLSPASQQTTPSPETATQESAEPVHKVTTENPTLWGIAEDRLGDGTRWKDIQALNPGVERGHELPEDTVLKMPSDTSPRQNTPTGETSGEDGEGSAHDGPKQPRIHVVETGETLWGIAEDELGDPTKWRKIADANPEVAPDPDVIHPRDKLTIPAQHAAPTDHTEEDENRQTDPKDQAEPDKDEAKPHPEHTTPRAKSPAPERPDSHSAPSAELPSPTPPIPDTSQAPSSAEQSTDTAVPVTALAVGGAVLATGLIGGLYVRRTLQQRRRRRGRRIPMPQGQAAKTEAEARAVEPPVGLESLDAVLRTTAAHLADAGRELPALRAVVLGRTIELHLTEPAPPVSPFTATDGMQRWTCPAGTQELLDQAELDATELPLPGLVTLGTLEDGRLLLVDLESVGVLRLTGPARHEAARTLMVELAMTPLTTELEVRLPESVAPGLAELCGERLLPYTEPEELLEPVRAQHIEQQRALATLGCDTPREARLGPAVGGWTPCVAVVDTNRPSGAALAEEVLALVEAEPRTATAVILTSRTAEEDDGSQASAGWAVHTTDSETLIEVPGTGLAYTPNLLSDADYGSILRLLATADADHDVAPPETASLKETGHDDDEDGEPSSTPTSSPPTGPGSPTGLAGPSVLIKMADRGLEEPDGHGSEPAPVDASAPHPPGVEARVRSGKDRPAVQVLGTVEVLGARGTVETKRIPRATELLAYLACHPGTDRIAIEEALWNGKPAKRQTVSSLISRARAWLGTREGSDQFFFPVITAETRYALDVDLDWTHFQHLVAHGQYTSGPDGTQALRQALKLVHGRPFAAVPPHRYVWAEPLVQDMIAAIVDAAELLAERALVQGAPREALWAAVRGLSAAPEAEQLRRAQFTALAGLGDTDGLRRAAAEMDTLNEHLGIEAEESTLETLRDLMSRT